MSFLSPTTRSLLHGLRADWMRRAKVDAGRLLALIKSTYGRPDRAADHFYAAQSWSLGHFLDGITSGNCMEYRRSRDTAYSLLDVGYPGGWVACRRDMIAAGERVIGAGWVWLVWEWSGTTDIAPRNRQHPLAVRLYSGAASPIVDERPCSPILALDVWEHAWLADYGPGRIRDYAAAWWEAVAWERVIPLLAVATSSKLVND